MRLSFSPKAALDLEEIGDYISRDNPTRALSFIDEIESHCQRIVETPAAFPFRNDLAPGVQMTVHGRYLILFRALPDTIRIERIVHGARKLSDFV
jgi:toxin ParE1/3/4